MAITFNYLTQQKKGGRVRKEEIVSASIQSAEKKLRDSQIPVLDIWRKEKIKNKFRKLAAKDLSILASQMQTTQAIQLKIIPSLELCSSTARTPKVAEVLAHMKETIERNGVSLKEAMKSTGAFDALSIGLVDAGEISGNLEQAFNQIKEINARIYEIQRKIKGVMIYPGIVICIAIGAIYTLMLKTVPVFVGMYAESGMKLPLPTQMLITLSDLTTKHPLEIGLICAAMIVCVIKIPTIYLRAHSLHGIILRLPGVGTIIKKSIQATFSRTLSDMLASQTRLVDALSFCRAVSGNVEYKGAIARATLYIAKGGAIGSAMANDDDIFGKFLIRSLQFGEETGHLDDVLRRVAIALDRELNEYVDQIKVIMEPVLTLFIGGITLFIMLALFIPVFSMSKLI